MSNIIIVPIYEEEIAIPKVLIPKLGPDTSIFLSVLLRKESQLRMFKTLDPSRYFTVTEKDTFDFSPISLYKQTKAIKLLTTLKILFPIQKKGIPQRRYFKINHDELSKFIQRQIEAN